jgi:hypothetical protein
MRLHVVQLMAQHAAALTVQKATRQLQQDQVMICGKLRYNRRLSNNTVFGAMAVLISVMRV